MLRPAYEGVPECLEKMGRISKGGYSVLTEEERAFLLQPVTAGSARTARKVSPAGAAFVGITYHPSPVTGDASIFCFDSKEEAADTMGSMLQHLRDSLQALQGGAEALCGYVDILAAATEAYGSCMEREVR